MRIISVMSNALERHSKAIARYLDSKRTGEKVWEIAKDAGITRQYLQRLAAQWVRVMPPVAAEGGSPQIAGDKGSLA